MIKMMVTVVIVFTVCWLPFNILVVMNRDHFVELFFTFPSPPSPVTQ